MLYVAIAALTVAWFLQRRKTRRLARLVRLYRQGRGLERRQGRRLV